MAIVVTDAERTVVAPPELAAQAEIAAADLRDIGLTVDVKINRYVPAGKLLIIDNEELNHRIVEGPWRR